MNTTTADPDAKAAPKKAKGGGLVRLLVIVVSFGAGASAGGFGAAIGAGIFGGVAGLGGGGHVAPAVAEKGPVEYVEIDNAFTSNLVDTGRYLQVRLSVSTTGGGTVVAAIGKHKPALISTVLSVLGELSEIDVADRPAKDKLRGRLKEAINDALKAKDEPVGIDEVFFTSLVVQ